MNEQSREDLLAEIERLKLELAAKETDERASVGGNVTDPAVVAGSHNQVGASHSTFGQQSQSVNQQVNVAGDNASVHHIRNVYLQAPGEPALDDAAFEQVLGRYLTWVCNRYGKLRLRGIEQREQPALSLTLDDVYVSLVASVTPERQRARRPGKDSTDLSETHVEQVEMNRLLSLGDRLMIVGGPGSGKTTYLHTIASALANALQHGNSAFTCRIEACTTAHPMC